MVDMKIFYDILLLTSCELQYSIGKLGEVTMMELLVKCWVGELDDGCEIDGLDPGVKVY
jgi:hypothetical protein